MKGQEIRSQWVKYFPLLRVGPVKGYRECEKRDRKKPKPSAYIIK